MASTGYRCVVAAVGGDTSDMDFVIFVAFSLPVVGLHWYMRVSFWGRRWRSFNGSVIAVDGGAEGGHEMDALASTKVGDRRRKATFPRQLLDNSDASRRLLGNNGASLLMGRIGVALTTAVSPCWNLGGWIGLAGVVGRRAS